MNPSSSFLWTITTWASAAAVYILPIIMACRYKCKNRTLIIILHIVLTLIGFWLSIPIGGIVSFIMIAVDKRKSAFYEDTGKNIVWLHIGLYALSILLLFAPLVDRDILDYVGLEKRVNILFFLKGNELYSIAGVNILQLVAWCMIVLPIIGFIVNLIFRDARKLIGANSILQIFIASSMASFHVAFGGYTGFAITCEAVIILISAISLFISAFLTSYVDN